MDTINSLMLFLSFSSMPLMRFFFCKNDLRKKKEIIKQEERERERSRGV